MKNNLLFTLSSLLFILYYGEISLFDLKSYYKKENDSINESYTASINKINEILEEIDSSVDEDKIKYLNFLNISLGSLGESVSGLYSYRKAKQISKEQFESLDALAYKLENGLLKLVESLENKRDRGDWIDHLVVRESNTVYGND